MRRGLKADWLVALLLVFLTLQVTGLIDWPWWVVLSPLWFPIAAILAFAIVAALVLFASMLMVILLEKLE